MVVERDPYRGPPKPYLYQAKEFRVGSLVPQEELKGLSKKELDQVWVMGVAYAPALHVRKRNKEEMKKGYLFNSEFNDADGDTALFGSCLEVVRIDNCTAWRPMADVMDAIPRVVHPEDIKCRRIHVAGRDWHFVCGVSGHEDVVKGKFAFEKMNRSDFFMHPEDVLGAQIQSASTMWERVESMFRSIRKVMTCSGNARSGSFSVAWPKVVMDFFEVQLYNYHVYLGVCYKKFLLFEHIWLIEINDNPIVAECLY
jgi:hypothetical protein